MAELDLGWGCHCCLPVDFDHVPGLSRAPSRRERLLPGQVAQLDSSAREGGRPLLSCAPCAATSSSHSESGPTPGAPDEAQRRRDIVARGQSRFEIGQTAPHQPDWEQLSMRVICVLGQNPSDFTLNGTNCYIVGNGRKRLLIDSGEEHHGSEAFLESLERCMEEHGVEGLSGIVITHMHHDHYGNLGKLQEKYGPIPVYTNAVQEPHHHLLHEVRRRGLERFFVDEEGRPRFNPRLHGLKPPDFPEECDLEWAESLVTHFPGASTGDKVAYIFFFQWSSFQLTDRLMRGVYEWRRLLDGDVISTDGATLTALHTPGHAPDHMSFLLEEEHSLFSGDHVLGWGTTLVADMRDYMATLRRMLELKPTRLYPGHGGFIRDGVDVLVRYTEHRHQREQQAWEALQRNSRPAAIRDIARELYPHLSEERMWMARDNVEKLFRKFVDDKSAAAYVMATDADGTQHLVPYEVPESYAVRRLPESLLWAAKRSMVMQSTLRPAQPSKL